jgi:superoxide dismutase, Cu-Zn family
MTIGTRQVGIGLALAAAVGAGATRAAAADKVAAGAYATLNPTQGSTVKGKVEFKPAKGGVLVTAHIEGLTPGTHGFHVHEKGDCSSGDGMSAGGHFNPGAMAHGSLATAHHAGDMPNLKADSYGNASATYDIPGVSIGSGAADIAGKGLIVHRDPDDYKTQPTGNAGPRLACAVIRKSG